RLTVPGLPSRDIAAVSPDRRAIVTTSPGHNAQVWSVTTHKRLGDLTAPDGSYPLGAEYSADGKEIVAAFEGTGLGIAYWSAPSRKLLGVIKRRLGSAPIGGAMFSRDDKEVAGIGPSAVYVWSVTSHKLLATVPVHSTGDAAFSPDGTEIVVPSSVGT